MKLISIICTAMVVLSCSVKPVSEWTDKEVNDWCAESEWFTSLPGVPYSGVNKRTFADQYQKNKEKWDAAYEFLSTKDLQNLPEGRYEVAEGTFANVQSYETKDSNRFEAHRKFIDIQVVISGEEDIAVSNLEDLVDEVVPYDEGKDIGFHATSSKSTKYIADAKNFLILFPTDAHAPCLSREQKSLVKKVVIKMPVAE